MGKARSIVRTLNFTKANFQLFKDLVGAHGKRSFGTRGAVQSWQIFKDAFQRAQKFSVPRCKK